MKDRMKGLRKALDLTQSEFGSRINLTQNYIAQIEMGRRDPSDRSIADMVREFHVNENWLRTGEGEMFTSLTAEEELASYMGGVLALPEDDPRYRIIMAMAKIPEKYWSVIREIMDIMVEGGKQPEQKA